MKSSDIQDLASLSYLSVSPDQNQKFQQDFHGILTHIETLSEITEATDTLPRYYHQYLREDICHDPNPDFTPRVRQDILDQMPRTDRDYLIVKSILKK